MQPRVVESFPAARGIRPFRHIVIERWCEFMGTDWAALCNRGGRPTPRGSPMGCWRKQYVAVADRQRQLVSRVLALDTSICRGSCNI